MNVDDVVAEKIAAARARIEADRQARAAFAERRRHGIAARHRAKLARQQQQEQPDNQEGMSTDGH